MNNTSIKSIKSDLKQLGLFDQLSGKDSFPKAYILKCKYGFIYNSNIGYNIDDYSGMCEVLGYRIEITKEFRNSHRFLEIEYLNDFIKTANDGQFKFIFVETNNTRIIKTSIEKLKFEIYKIAIINFEKCQ